MIWVLFMVMVYNGGGGVTVSDHLVFPTKEECESWEGLIELDMYHSRVSVASHVCIAIAKP